MWNEYRVMTETIFVILQFGRMLKQNLQIE